MKRAMVYILALAMAFSVLLSGCGENRGSSNNAAPTAKPQTSNAPETMMPDPEDGVVKDENGIITDGDTGDATDDHDKVNGTDDSVIPSGSNGMDSGPSGTNGSVGSGTGTGTGTGTNGSAGSGRMDGGTGTGTSGSIGVGAGTP